MPEKKVGEMLESRQYQRVTASGFVTVHPASRTIIVYDVENACTVGILESCSRKEV